MSEPVRLSLVPSPRDERILDWLMEPEPVDAARLLERVEAEVADLPQARPLPWDALLDMLRPKPFGRPGARAMALVVAIALVLAAALGLVAVAGRPTDQVRPAPTGGPSAAPAASPVASPTDAARGTTPAVLAANPLLADPPLELVLLDAAGKATVRRTDSATSTTIASDISAPLGQPAWHPADDHVLILDWDDIADQLWRVPTDGADRSLVLIPCVDPCRSHNEASWSHDGSRVVMFQARGDVVDGIPTTCGIAIWWAASQQIEDVTASPCAVTEERDPRFAPDDSVLAFWRSRAAGGRSTVIADAALIVRDLATGKERRLTDWSLHASSADWSPDGTWLTFVTDSWNESEAGELWRVRSDGGGLERLLEPTPGARLLRPRYTPDGRWILFIQISDGRGKLLAVPADGGEAIEALPGTSVLDYDVRAAAP